MRTKRWGGGPATLVLIDRSHGSTLMVIHVGNLQPNDLKRLKAQADSIDIDLQLVDFPVAEVLDERSVAEILRGFA